ELTEFKLRTFQTPIPRNVISPILAALSAGGLFFAATARAQLGETQTNGVTINACGIYLSGNTRDLDCSVCLHLRRPKISEESHIGKIQVLGAVDDFGNNLIRANGARQHTPVTNAHSQLIWLMNPSARARSISIEGEVELFTPTIPQPVITNFMSRSS